MSTRADDTRVHSASSLAREGIMSRLPDSAMVIAPPHTASHSSSVVGYFSSIPPALLVAEPDSEAHAAVEAPRPPVHPSAGRAGFQGRGDPGGVHGGVSAGDARAAKQALVMRVIVIV